MEFEVFVGHMSSEKILKIGYLIFFWQEIIIIVLVKHSKNKICKFYLERSSL
jgi:hypothetical protein